MTPLERYQWQRNGFYPVQIGDWIPNEHVAEIKAANAPNPRH